MVQDIFMTPTAEYAESSSGRRKYRARRTSPPHAHQGARRDVHRYVSQKIAQIAERRSDWEFIVGLGQALGYEDYFPSIEDFANEALKPMGMTWDELKQHDYVVEPMRYRKYEQEVSEPQPASSRSGPP